LETFGADLGGGYDVGCRFRKSLDTSPLGPLAQQLNHTSLVGAFHGHAHNRICQLSHLATYQKGLGLSALENCESFFSKSNKLAGSLRHASVFHHRQSISTYLKHTDTFETYASLSTLFQPNVAFLSTSHLFTGTFLYNHYKNALDILSSGPASLAKAMADLGIENDGVFHTWLLEEEVYLKALRSEPQVETLEMNYYQRLVNLRTASEHIVTLSLGLAEFNVGSH